MQVIKKHSNRNEYLLTADRHWVRNFGLSVPALDLNRLYSPADLRVAVENEQANAVAQLPSIDGERFRFDRVVVVNDGTGMSAHADLLKRLADLPNTAVIAVNGALARWQPGWKFHFYLINHPGSDAMTFLPQHRYLPTCIASLRTSSEFVRRYERRGGLVFQYVPTPEVGWKNGSVRATYTIDDYRNPVCAALHLACRWSARRVLLVTPHDLLPEARPAAQKLNSGVYMYPQQLTAHRFIDAAAYWLSQFDGCEVGHLGDGPDFQHAAKLNPPSAADFIAG